jgi:alanine dehydrogenase
MPGAVGRTSTFALCNVTLPWVLRVAEQGIVAAAMASRPLARAVNMFDGAITNRAVAETFGMDYSSRFETSG